MSALPFGKFFWSDYASDHALKVCSFAAQGLWMRMLCIAAEHDPVGYVAINGDGLDDRAIARATGGDSDEVLALLSELEKRGVFSRDRRGWIYSRRMIRDAKKARKARENGKLGGSPTLRKQKENPSWDNHQLKGGDKTHIPEAIFQKEKEEESGGAEAPDGSYAFLGQTIRLNARHLGEWRQAFHAVPDLNAELMTIDGWWQDQPADRRKRWFHATMGMLNRKHQEMMAKQAEDDKPGVLLGPC